MRPREGDSLHTGLTNYKHKVASSRYIGAVGREIRPFRIGGALIEAEVSIGLLTSFSAFLRLPLSQSDTRSTAVLVKEFDTCSLQSQPYFGTSFIPAA